VLAGSVQLPAKEIAITDISKPEYSINRLKAETAYLLLRKGAIGAEGRPLNVSSPKNGNLLPDDIRAYAVLHRAKYVHLNNEAVEEDKKNKTLLEAMIRNGSLLNDNEKKLLMKVHGFLFFGDILTAEDMAEIGTMVTSRQKQIQDLKGSDERSDQSLGRQLEGLISLLKGISDPANKRVAKTAGLTDAQFRLLMEFAEGLKSGNFGDEKELISLDRRADIRDEGAQNLFNNAVRLLSLDAYGLSMYMILPKKGESVLQERKRQFMSVQTMFDGYAVPLESLSDKLLMVKAVLFENESGQISAAVAAMKAMKERMGAREALASPDFKNKQDELQSLLAKLSPYVDKEFFDRLISRKSGFESVLADLVSTLGMNIDYISLPLPLEERMEIQEEVRLAGGRLGFIGKIIARDGRWQGLGLEAGDDARTITAKQMLADIMMLLPEKLDSNPVAAALAAVPGPVWPLKAVSGGLFATDLDGGFINTGTDNLFSPLNQLVCATLRIVQNFSARTFRMAVTSSAKGLSGRSYTTVEGMAADQASGANKQLDYSEFDGARLAITRTIEKMNGLGEVDGTDRKKAELYNKNQMILERLKKLLKDGLIKNIQMREQAGGRTEFYLSGNTFLRTTTHEYGNPREIFLPGQNDAAWLDEFSQTVMDASMVIGEIEQCETKCSNVSRQEAVIEGVHRFIGENATAEVTSAEHVLGPAALFTEPLETAKAAYRAVAGAGGDVLAKAQADISDKYVAGDVIAGLAGEGAKFWIMPYGISVLFTSAAGEALDLAYEKLFGQETKAVNKRLVGDKDDPDSGLVDKAWSMMAVLLNFELNPVFGIKGMLRTWTDENYNLAETAGASVFWVFQSLSSVLALSHLATGATRWISGRKKVWYNHGYATRALIWLPKKAAEVIDRFTLEKRKSWFSGGRADEFIYGAETIQRGIEWVFSLANDNGAPQKDAGSSSDIRSRLARIKGAAFRSTGSLLRISFNLSMGQYLRQYIDAYVRHYSYEVLKYADPYKFAVQMKNLADAVELQTGKRPTWAQTYVLTGNLRRQMLGTVQDEYGNVWPADHRHAGLLPTRYDTSGTAEYALSVKGGVHSYRVCGSDHTTYIFNERSMSGLLDSFPSKGPSGLPMISVKVNDQAPAGALVSGDEKTLLSLEVGSIKYVPGSELRVEAYFDETSSAWFARLVIGGDNLRDDSPRALKALEQRICGLALGTPLQTQRLEVREGTNGTRVFTEVTDQEARDIFEEVVRTGPQSETFLQGSGGRMEAAEKIKELRRLYLNNGSSTSQKQRAGQAFRSRWERILNEAASGSVNMENLRMRQYMEAIYVVKGHILLPSQVAGIKYLLAGKFIGKECSGGKTNIAGGYSFVESEKNPGTTQYLTTWTDKSTNDAYGELKPVFDLLGKGCGLIDRNNPARTAIENGRPIVFSGYYTLMAVDADKSAVVDFRGRPFLDEMDFILIDSAGNPLIMVGPSRETLSKAEADRYRALASVTKHLVGEADPSKYLDLATGRLTDVGIEEAAKWFAPYGLGRLSGDDFAKISLCYKASHMIQQNRLIYHARDNAVYMRTTEPTDEILTDRRLGGGLHQAAEAMLDAPILREYRVVSGREPIAFARKFAGKYVGGSGTAAVESYEKVYKQLGVEVAVLPESIRNIDYEAYRGLTELNETRTSVFFDENGRACEAIRIIGRLEDRANIERICALLNSNTYRENAGKHIKATFLIKDPTRVVANDSELARSVADRITAELKGSDPRPVLVQVAGDTVLADSIAATVTGSLASNGNKVKPVKVNGVEIGREFTFTEDIEETRVERSVIILRDDYLSVAQREGILKKVRNCGNKKVVLFASYGRAVDVRVKNGPRKDFLEIICRQAPHAAAEVQVLARAPRLLDPGQIATYLSKQDPEVIKVLALKPAATDQEIIESLKQSAVRSGEELAHLALLQAAYGSRADSDYYEALRNDISSGRPDLRGPVRRIFEGAVDSMIRLHPPNTAEGRRGLIGAARDLGLDLRIDGEPAEQTIKESCMRAIEQKYLHSLPRLDDAMAQDLWGRVTGRPAALIDDHSGRAAMLPAGANAVSWRDWLSSKIDNVGFRQRSKINELVRELSVNGRKLPEGITAEDEFSRSSRAIIDSARIDLAGVLAGHLRSSGHARRGLRLFGRTVVNVAGNAEQPTDRAPLSAAPETRVQGEPIILEGRIDMSKVEASRRPGQAASNSPADVQQGGDKALQTDSASSGGQAGPITAEQAEALKKAPHSSDRRAQSTAEMLFNGLRDNPQLISREAAGQLKAVVVVPDAVFTQNNIRGDAAMAAGTVYIREGAFIFDAEGKLTAEGCERLGKAIVHELTETHARVHNLERPSGLEPHEIGKMAEDILTPARADAKPEAEGAAPQSSNAASFKGRLVEGAKGFVVSAPLFVLFGTAIDIAYRGLIKHEEIKWTGENGIWMNALNNGLGITEFSSKVWIGQAAGLSAGAAGKFAFFYDSMKSWTDNKSTAIGLGNIAGFEFGTFAAGLAAKRFGLGQGMAGGISIFLGLLFAKAGEYSTEHFGGKYDVVFNNDAVTAAKELGNKITSLDPVNFLDSLFPRYDSKWIQVPRSIAATGLSLAEFRAAIWGAEKLFSRTAFQNGILNLPGAHGLITKTAEGMALKAGSKEAVRFTGKAATRHALGQLASIAVAGEYGWVEGRQIDGDISDLTYLGKSFAGGAAVGTTSGLLAYGFTAPALTVFTPFTIVAAGIAADSAIAYNITDYSRNKPGNIFQSTCPRKKRP